MTTVTGTDVGDILSVTGDSDTFDGRGGSDVFLIWASSGFNTFSDTGTSGVDRIVAQDSDIKIGLASEFGPWSGIEVISAGGFSGVSIQGGPSDDTFDFSATKLIGIEKIAGGGGADRIAGSSGKDDIRGDNKADTLYGGAGDDSLYGGDKNDLLPDLDALHGVDGNDYLAGNGGNDQLAGGSDNDSMLGGTGIDLIYGGRGADTMSGGSGADTFLYKDLGEGGDVITDFETNFDKVDVTSIDANSNLAGDQAFLWGGVDSAAQANSVTVSIQQGNTIAQFEGTGDTAADLTIVFAGILTLDADDFLL